MADSGNSNYSSLKASSQNGTQVDLKAKLRKVEIDDGMLRGTVKRWIFGVQEKTFALVFDEVEEGGPLHQCGIRKGDELNNVNNAEVNSSHDVNHIASVIRDCSQFMLGMRRRRAFYSVPFVVVCSFGDADANPAYTFCGFYWNVSPHDIPFIPITYPSIKNNVEVIGMTGDKQNWLTFKNGKLTFENKRSTLFQLYVYPQTGPRNPVPGYTPVIFVLQQDQSFALDATKDDKIQMSRFNRQKIVRGSGLFLKVFGVDDNIYHIKSTQTDSYLEVSKCDDGTMEPVMSSNPTTIRLFYSTEDF